LPSISAPAGKSWSQILFYTITALPNTNAQLIPATYKVLGGYSTGTGLMQISRDGGTNFNDCTDTGENDLDIKAGDWTMFPDLPISDGVNIRLYNDDVAPRDYLLAYQTYS